MKTVNKNIGPKGKDLSVFVRFGGLDLKTQHGYTKEQKTFHSPPAPRGFYAFPKVAQEFFLIGSMDRFQPGVLPKGFRPYPGDNASKEEIDAWRKESNEYDFDTLEKKTRKIKSLIRKEFKKTTGNVWSHLEKYVKQSEVIDRHGSWVKTSIKEWQRAFNKMSLDHRLANDPWMKSTNINEVRGITGWYSKDHCEVFFDEKI